MTVTYKQDCPLCDNEAEYVLADYGRLKHFECGTSTQFQISKMAEPRVLQDSQAMRDRCSLMARNAPEGHTLVITVPPIQPDQEGAFKAYVGKYIKDAALCS